MGKYGKAAELAAQLLSRSEFAEPKVAWKAAVARVFPDSLSSQAKGCPRDSFLGLCGMGVIEGVPPGTYTRSLKNKRYVARALTALRSDPSLADAEDRLWQIATEGMKKVPNHQIDVLTSLWRKGFIRNGL